MSIALPLASHAQKSGIKSDLLYDATATFNLWIEAKMGEMTILDASGNYNPWRFNGDPRSMNNLGVALLRDRDKQSAERYFRRAAEEGNLKAAYNPENLACLRQELLLSNIYNI